MKAHFKKKTRWGTLAFSHTELHYGIQDAIKTGWAAICAYGLTVLTFDNCKNRTRY